MTSARVIGRGGRGGSCSSSRPSGHSHRRLRRLFSDSDRKEGKPCSQRDSAAKRASLWRVPVITLDTVSRLRKTDLRTICGVRKSPLVSGRVTGGPRVRGWDGGRSGRENGLSRPIVRELSGEPKTGTVDMVFGVTLGRGRVSSPLFEDPSWWVGP